MSNKSKIQTLNTKYESLIEELRGKAVGGGSGGNGKKTVTITVTGMHARYACYFAEDGTPKRVAASGETIEALGGALLRSGTSAVAFHILTGNGFILSTTSGISGSVMSDYSSVYCICVCTEDNTVVDMPPGGGVND